MTEEQNKLAGEIERLLDQRVAPSNFYADDLWGDKAYKLLRKCQLAVLSEPATEAVQGWPKRVGTNLLTADEARQMLEHVLNIPAPESPAKEQDEILAELDEAGATGLDMSPGDPLARKAAAAIRLLIKRIAVVASQRDATSAKEQPGEQIAEMVMRLDVVMNGVNKDGSLTCSAQLLAEAAALLAKLGQGCTVSAWLIELGEESPVAHTYFAAGGGTKNAWVACWFSRKVDAEAVAFTYLQPEQKYRIVSHGFEFPTPPERP